MLSFYPFLSVNIEEELQVFHFRDSIPPRVPNNVPQGVLIFFPSMFFIHFFYFITYASSYVSHTCVP
jgi:hypothetical protein